MYRNIDVLGHQISVSVSVLRHKTRKHSELQQANDHVYRFIVLLSQRCLYSTECFPLTSQTSYVSPSITVITPKLVLFLWFFYTGLAQSHKQTTFLFHPYTHRDCTLNALISCASLTRACHCPCWPLCRSLLSRTVNDATIQGGVPCDKDYRSLLSTMVFLFIL